MGWWLIASLLVISLGWIRRKPAVTAPIFGGLLLSILLFTFFHPEQIPIGSSWVMRWAVILSAASCMAYLEDLKVLRLAVLGCAWIQIAFMLLQAAGVETIFRVAGSGVAGTLAKRAALSIFLGFASMLCKGRCAWLFAGASVVTGSLAGSVPAVAKLLFPLFMKARGMGISAMAGAVLLLIPLGWDRLLLRLQAWSEGPSFLARGWLNGWGFYNLPGGFTDENMARSIHDPMSLMYSDYHSTFVDYVARFGLPGLITLAAVMAWLFFRVRVGLELWLLGLAVWACAFQSAESFPSMMMLGVFLFMHLVYKERDSDVPPV